MTESQPKEIGRYKVQEELGRGGFGRVYRAYDPTVGRPVAIKILTDVSADTQTRFRNEAMVAGNLRHKNIVTVYEYGSYEGLPFLAMEYLEGEDLHHILASRKPLTLLEKCAIMSQVADGLCYAHANGVVHRDMKPANIMVLRDGTVKIMDFGIARLTSTPDATRLTQQGYLIGTLRYMAPEQLAGADFDPRCDIFAYGVIFYELLSGSHPFDAPDAQRLMYKLSFEDPRPIHDLVPALPPGLGHAISRMIQKDRDRRYRTVKDLQFDIEPVRFELQKGRASELLQQAQSLFEQKQLEPAQDSAAGGARAGTFEQCGPDALGGAPTADPAADAAAAHRSRAERRRGAFGQSPLCGCREGVRIGAPTRSGECLHSGTAGPGPRTGGPRQTNI